ncbi:MAG: hypothetical protein V1726_01720, partial [Methanobacteriota archaeon]
KIGPYASWPLYRDAASGCGGGGEGGNGGNGGKIEIYYANNLIQGSMYATGGSGGNGGSQGESPCDDLDYPARLFQYFNYGADGVSGGGRGEESYVADDCTMWGDPATPGFSGSNGNSGQIIPPYHHKYVASGGYNKILDAGAIVDWQDAIVDQTMPEETNIVIQYEENTSDSWVYYDNLSDVPDSRWLKVQINLSTTNYSITPDVQKINVSYCRRVLNISENVPNGSYVNYQWNNLSLNTTYYWQVLVSYQPSTLIYGPIWEFTTVQNDTFWITSVSANPDQLGYGFNTTIHADVLHGNGTITSVNVNITYPDATSQNYTMNNTVVNTYEYVFSDTWQNGQYNYVIWAVNDTGVSVNSSGHSFNVSVNATLTIATLKDHYGPNEYINLTDPPEDPHMVVVDRGLTWNKYYNPTTKEYALSTSTAPLNYQNETTEEYTPINTTITSQTICISGNNYVYGMTHAGYQVFFREKSSQTFNRPIAFLNRDYAITYSPWESLGFDDGTVVSGKKQAIAQVENNGIVYPGQYDDGIDLIYACQPMGIVEQLVVDNPDRLPIPDDQNTSLVLKETVRAYELHDGEENRSTGILYGKDRLHFKTFNQWEDNEITTTEPIWFTDEHNQTVYYIPELYAWDSNISHDQILLMKRLHMTRFGNLRIEVLTPWSWLCDTNTTYPVFIDSTTMSGSVGLSSDDCHESTDGAVYNDTATELRLGKWAGSPTRYYNTSLRFTNISIPPGSTITDAYIHWHKYAYGKLTMPQSYHHYEIRCIDEDNTSTFSADDRPSERSYTSNSTDWDWTQSSNDGTYSYADSPDISSSVQEVINRVGWMENQSLGITVFDDASQLQYKIHSYNYSGGSNPPLLNITFIPPVNNPPDQPTYVYPANNSEGISCLPTLNVYVSDDDNDTLSVQWYANTSSYGYCTLHPEENGSSTQLLVHDADYNYQAVDEVDLNTLDYVYTQNQDTWVNDTYTLQNHSSETAGINSVTVYAVVGKDGKMQGGHPWNQYRFVMKSNDSWNETTANNLPDTTVNYTWMTNPATGLAWTWDDIDDLEMGIGFKGSYFLYNKCYQLYIMVIYSDPGEHYFIRFQENNSVPSGCNVTAVNQNFSRNNTRYWWYVTVSDGANTTASDVYTFDTNIQSKITNTGTTNISGYLLIQVQFYNETLEEWVVANDTVNETTQRRINVSEQLALDQFFNGKVNTSDLLDEYGPGWYRVYAAFRDPYGEALVCDDETVLAAWYEFEITT